MEALSGNDSEERQEEHEGTFCETGRDGEWLERTDDKKSMRNDKQRIVRKFTV
jgi:hypothetical protein